MKKAIFVALSAAFSLFACTTSMHDGYTIDGTITGDSVSSGKVFLSNLSQDEPILDTADLIDGKFTFEGKVSTPEDYSITFDRIKGRISLFLDNSHFRIEAAAEELDKAVISGGVTNDIVTALRKQHEKIATKFNLDSLVREYHKNETAQARKDSIISILDSFQTESRKVDSIFFATNPTSPYTLIQYFKTIEEHPIEKMEARLATFRNIPSYAENRYLKAFEETIRSLKKLEPGNKAPDFTMKDPSGKSISFSSIYTKNKVTMLDFWASWCVPCHKFHPALSGIYSRFSEAGFGILSVSLDKNVDDWSKGIADDKLIWDNVSDLQFWNNAAAKLYHVKSIPQNIFVDQNGIIIRRKVEKNEITPFLQEMLVIDEQPDLNPAVL